MKIAFPPGTMIPGLGQKLKSSLGEYVFPLCPQPNITLPRRHFGVVPIGDMEFASINERGRQLRRPHHGSDVTLVAFIAAKNSNGGTSQAVREVAQVLHLLCAKLAFAVEHFCWLHDDLFRHVRPTQSRLRMLRRPRNNKCADQNQSRQVRPGLISAVGRT
jgi:hypothetical protein